MEPQYRTRSIEHSSIRSLFSPPGFVNSLGYEGNGERASASGCKHLNLNPFPLFPTCGGLGLQETERFEIPTWEQIYSMLLDLAEKIRGDRFVPDVIVGVSRGGWTPARVLSDLLENPEIANVKAEFYLGVAETMGQPVITQSISVNVKDKSVLVVDDVSDTGRSLHLVKEHLLEQGARSLRVAALYFKPWSITEPDYFQKTTSDWIIFPWERKEALRKVVEKFQQRGKSAEEAKNLLVKHGFNQDLATRFIKEVAEDPR